MSTTPERTFGTEFRRIRRESQKTLEDVARIMGVSIPHVSDIERGRRSPPPRAMIAQILEQWGRAEELDSLSQLAMRYRGEFQRAPKNANEERVLVALERALDVDLSTAEYDQILRFLEDIRRRGNG
jgi:transcriptional regulator with XRE-family HTH domain